MKQKYVQTLKQMKEELMSSKQHGWKRLESEWKTRKARLDAEWSQKLQDRLRLCGCSI
jgi:hypothetical protein